MLDSIKTDSEQLKIFIPQDTNERSDAEKLALIELMVLALHKQLKTNNHYDMYFIISAMSSFTHYFKTSSAKTIEFKAELEKIRNPITKKKVSIIVSPGARRCEQRGGSGETMTETKKINGVNVDRATQGRIKQLSVNQRLLETPQPHRKTLFF